MTIIPTVIGAFGTVTKILLKVLEETCCHSISSERLSAKTDMKNSKGVNNNTKSSIN